MATAAAAAAGTSTGGLVHLRTPHLSPPPRSASPCFGTSRTPRRFWPSQTLPQRRLHRAPLPAAASVAAVGAAYTEPEEALLEALLGVQGRGRGVAPRQLQARDFALPSSRRPLLRRERRAHHVFGEMRRTFVGVDSFRIFQEVYLRTDDPRVVNVVRFSESVGDLKVEAEATIENGKRILFRFDRAAFTFKFLPFKVPYPVPFRLLGDEAKGWLDTTYLSPSGNIRISRGNKVIDDFISSKRGTEVDLNILFGEWQLLWASQTEGQTWSSTASIGLKGFQIIKKDGQLRNSLSPVPGVSLNASGNIFKKNSNTFGVSMKDGAVQVGVLQLPLDTLGELVMEILYVDNKIRISRLNQHMLVHLRISNTT
ncbi:hypothetical protein EJB05_12784, partial [Eragrostis curvula]